MDANPGPKTPLLSSIQPSQNAGAGVPSAAAGAVSGNTATDPDSSLNVKAKATRLRSPAPPRSPCPSPSPSLTSSASTTSQTPNLLYISHALSTFSSRTFEFAAVLFLSHTYPSTLLPASLYALGRALAAVVLSGKVGRMIDTCNRLSLVRWSIVLQRAAVAGSCLAFAGMAVLGGFGTAGKKDVGFLGLLLILACVEKVASIANFVAVERDWVVVITTDDEAGRKILNSRLRAIDLTCKLLCPLLVSILDTISPLLAICTIFFANLVSVAPEYVTIAKVYRLVPLLQRRRGCSSSSSSSSFSPPSHMSSSSSPQPQNPSSPSPSPTTTNTTTLSPLSIYIRSPSFSPSFALSLLYLTVLSFSSQMITYLLSLSLPITTPGSIAVLRGISTFLELSATWIVPRLLMPRLGVLRAGMWCLSWQMGWLAVGVGMFLKFGAGDQAGGDGAWGHTFGDQYDGYGHGRGHLRGFGYEPGEEKGDGNGQQAVRMKSLAAAGLILGVILSRVGLWGFDLCAQLIVQDETPSSSRGTFSTTESSLQNVFELVSFACTIVFPSPKQFKYPVLLSVGAVYVAGAIYAAFLRRRRGHLFHKPRSRCIELLGRKRARVGAEEQAEEGLVRGREGS